MRLQMPATNFAEPQVESFETWRTWLAADDAQAHIKLVVALSRWTAQHPESPEGWSLLGDAYLKMKQPYAAQQAYRKAQTASPLDARALEGLGLALLEIGGAKSAIDFFEQAHRAAPTNDEIVVHWGLAHLALGQLRSAHRLFSQATDMAPNNAHAWHNLGLVDLQRDKPGSALDHLQKALALQPSLAAAHHHAALALRALDRLSEAIAAAEVANKVAPMGVDHALLLADLQLDCGWPQEAEKSLARATHLNPSAPGIYICRARMFTMLGKFADALGTLTTATQLGGDETAIQFASSQTRLLSQDWAAGWGAYEARKRLQPSPVRHFPFVEWDGNDPEQHTILVHAEQGLGSTILFAQCLPDLIRHAHHVVLEVPTELATLMQRSFPEITVVGRHPRWDTETAWMERHQPPITRQIAIGSLPRLFRRQAEDFPITRQPYLVPDPARVSHWRKELSGTPLPTVGIVWAGGMPQTGRHYRSISAELLAPHLEHLPCKWVSLQHNSGGQDSGPSASTNSWNVQHWPLAFQTLDELAALTSALDYVVTVCGTQAHLCGALGRPAFVLTPSAPPWPYGTQGTKTIWHPSLTLIRQQNLHEWLPVLNSLAQALSELLTNSESNHHAAPTH